MSQQACAEFFAKVNANITLQQEVSTALEGKEGIEAANAFVWVGAKHGYEYTAEEAVNQYQEIVMAATEAELDEEALDQVAGGQGGFGGPGGQGGFGGGSRPPGFGGGSRPPGGQGRFGGSPPPPPFPPFPGGQGGFGAPGGSGGFPG